MSEITDKPEKNKRNRKPKFQKGTRQDYPQGYFDNNRRFAQDAAIWEQNYRLGPGQGKKPSYEEVKRMYNSGNKGVQKAVDQSTYKGEYKRLLYSLGSKLALEKDPLMKDMDARSKMRAVKMMLMDSFFGSDFFGKAWNMAKTYGPDIVGKAVEHYSGVPINELLGTSGKIQDSGAGMQLTEVPVRNDQYGIDAVNVDYVQGVLDPTCKVERKPQVYNVQTSLSSYTQLVNLTVNSSGNGAIIINPNAPFGDKASDIRSFISIKNDVGFDPNTGVNGTMTPTRFFGPLYSQAANVGRWQPLSFKISVKSIQATNNDQGMVSVVYWNQPFNTGLASGTANIGLPEMPTQPFYRCESLNNCDVEMIRVPCDVDSQLYFTTQYSGSYVEGFYILVTGASASSQVLDVKITSNYEFVPLSSLIPVCVQDFAKPGIASDSFVQNLFKMFPYLQHSTEAQIHKLVDCIKGNGSLNHDALMKCAGQLFGGGQMQQNKTHVVRARAQPNIFEESVEYIP